MSLSSLSSSFSGLSGLQRRWSTYLYLQDLLVGAAVVVLGEVDRPALERAGAKSVQLCDMAGLEAQPAGACDVLLALDVEPSQLDALLGQAARVLGPEGKLVVGGVNRDRSGLEAEAGGGFSYYQLTDALESRFAEVKMVGQAPFFAASLVEYGVPDPEPVLDGRLIGRGEKVERYLAVAARKTLARSRGFVVVQLPFGEQAAAPQIDPELPAKLVALEAECSKLREKEKDARTDAWKAAKARSEAEAAAAEVREDTVRKLKDARKLASVELMRAMEEATKKAVTLKEELGRSERERKDLKIELETTRGDVARLQSELETARALPPPTIDPPPTATVMDPAHEQALAEVKARVAELELELGRRDSAVERAAAAAGHERARAERLVAEGRHALGERNEARARSAEAEARAATLAVEVEEVQARLTVEEGRANQAESDLQAKKERVKQLKRELEESENRLVEADARAAHLELVRQRLGAVESALRVEEQRMAGMEEALRRAAGAPASVG